MPDSTAGLTRSARTVLRLLAISLGTMLVLTLMPQPANASSVNTGTLEVINLSGGGDAFYNYDFNSENASSSNVDFAVDLIFAGNATINKLGPLVSPQMTKPGSAMYEFLGINADSVGTWDSNKGLKQRDNTNCSGLADYHFRAYATPGADRMYNMYLGYFVIATAHSDVNENCSSGSYSGDNEQAEAYVAGLFKAKGKQVLANEFNWHNKETTHVGSHHWNNNGLATEVILT